MPKLLIVDDEPNVRYSLKKSLNSEDVEISRRKRPAKGWR